jgi:hypothetical protein
MGRSRATSPAVEAACVLFGLAIFAIVATYPLITTMADHLPGDVGDPVLNTWILGWDAARLRHGIGMLWDAPNFFPYRHTLTYSDHLLGIAVFTAPIQWLTGNPVLTYNLAFLASWVLSAGGMYVLVRSLTGRADAAVIAAAVYVCAPFRIAHIYHLQWLMIGWLPLSLWALHRYFATGAWRFALASGGCFLLQALTASYFMYFALLPLACVAVADLRGTRVPARRMAVQAAAVLLLLVAAIAPVARAYDANREQYGMRRPMAEIVDHSADLRDFLSASRLAVFERMLPDGGSEHALFPGLVTMALALAGVVAFRRRSVVTVYAGIAIAALILSFGPEPAAWGHHLPFPGPYRLLLTVVPGLDGLRAPARLASVLVLSLGVLAGFGAVWLLDRAVPRRRTAITIAMLAAVIAEGWVAPMPVAAFDPGGNPRDRAAYEYLRGLPPGGTLELPLGEDEDEFRYQYMTLVHGHAVVNGHSGYLSPLLSYLTRGHSPLAEADHFDAVLAMASAIGVRYVILHRDDFKDRTLFDDMMATVKAHPERVTTARDFGGIVLLTVPYEPLPRRPDALRRIAASTMRVTASDGADRLPFLFDGDLDSRWLTGAPQRGTEWIDLQLDRRRDVAMISLIMAERSFGDYPRGLAVDVTDDSGVRTVYEGPVLPQFAQGLVAHPEYPSIDIVLPSNHARAIRLRQTATTHSFFWSVHELQLWER